MSRFGPCLDGPGLGARRRIAARHSLCGTMAAPAPDFGRLLGALILPKTAIRSSAPYVSAIERVSCPSATFEIRLKATEQDCVAETGRSFTPVRQICVGVASGHPIFQCIQPCTIRQGWPSVEAMVHKLTGAPTHERKSVRRSLFGSPHDALELSAHLRPYRDCSSASKVDRLTRGPRGDLLKEYFNACCFPETKTSLPACHAYSAAVG